MTDLKQRPVGRECDGIPVIPLPATAAAQQSEEQADRRGRSASTAQHAPSTPPPAHPPAHLVDKGLDVRL